METIGRVSGFGASGFTVARSLSCQPCFLGFGARSLLKHEASGFIGPIMQDYPTRGLNNQEEYHLHSAWIVVSQCNRAGGMLVLGSEGVRPTRSQESQSESQATWVSMYVYIHIHIHIHIHIYTGVLHRYINKITLSRSLFIYTYTYSYILVITLIISVHI